MNTLSHKVVSKEAVPAFILGRRVAGGEEKRCDTKPVFEGWPMFGEGRRSPELFGEVVVGPDGCGVVWGDEWDVEGDELFANRDGGAARRDERRVASNERGMISSTKGTEETKGEGRAQ